MYNFSKDKFKFDEYLKFNNFNLDENLKIELLNPKLKSKANKIYKYLKSRNIKIVPINSKYYPHNLKNTFLPPLCIYITGDINLLENKKIYIYEDKNISKYANKIIELLYVHMLTQDKYLILNKNLNIKGINLLTESFDIKFNEGINVYYNLDNKRNIIREIEVQSGILDLLIIPEADYNRNISIFVDSFLELGKEILIFPNEIFNKNAYFSNYLIKNGANIITNIYQVQDILENL